MFNLAFVMSGVILLVFFQLECFSLVSKNLLSCMRHVVGSVRRFSLQVPDSGKYARAGDERRIAHI